MENFIFVLPSSKLVGTRLLTKSIELSLEQKGAKVASFHPIYDAEMSFAEVEKYLLGGDIKGYIESLLNTIYRKYKDYDVLIIQGLFRQTDYSHQHYSINGGVFSLNRELIKALNSKVIIASHHGNKELSEINDEMQHLYKSMPKNTNVLGGVITKLNAQYDRDGHLVFSLTDENIDYSEETISLLQISELDIFKKIKLIGAISWSNERTYPRVSDIKDRLHLNSLFDSKLEKRVERVMMCSRRVEHFIKDLKPNSLVVTSADRSDILIATCLAAKKGMPISAIILTLEELLDDDIKELCLDVAKDAGLMIFTTKNKSINTIIKIAEIDFMGIPKDDIERLQKSKQAIINSIDIEYIFNSLKEKNSLGRLMSPPAFRYYLLNKSQMAKKRIILPESYEFRTLQAAKKCHEQKIADCVLIGDAQKIHKVAELHGFTLPKDIEIISEDVSQSTKYLEALLELRKHKGLSEPLAQSMLTNPLVAATLMLQLGEVDGLVSGAEHTTADVLRPALQLIKTKPDSSLVSSVFFMCMPDEVVVFGDCAVNQEPTAEELVDIAIQSAQSAEKFGIEPRVAMISYSTGNSGSGQQVEKVKTATKLLQQKAPELLVDGPLQYDAAMIESVAKKKAPDSKVAGKASVLIFPDLNTGNAVYKAVQRSGNILSIGPVLQGINKPVNDLSRGASVDDIIYTIAITAIQAI